MSNYYDDINARYGGSEYFTGGCGCDGSVSGGGYVTDNGIWGTLSNLWNGIVSATGVNHMKEGLSNTDKPAIDRINHFALGFLILNIVVLIVLFALGHDSSYGWAITAWVFVSISAVVVIGTEVWQRVMKNGMGGDSIGLTDSVVPNSLNNLI